MRVMIPIRIWTTYLLSRNRFWMINSRHFLIACKNLFWNRKKKKKRIYNNSNHCVLLEEEVILVVLILFLIQKSCS